MARSDTDFRNSVPTEGVRVGATATRLAKYFARRFRRSNGPLSGEDLPETPVILDLLEFCAQAVGEPIEGDFHSFFGHSHLSWDREAGLATFVASVNRLFARNGVGFALTEGGEAQRVLPEALEAPLRRGCLRYGRRGDGSAA